MIFATGVRKSKGQFPGTHVSESKFTFGFYRCLVIAWMSMHSNSD